jgi:hypothetical protein
MTEPRYFFETFVLPAVKAWEQSQLDIRLATDALCQLDILAEHYAKRLGKNHTDERRRLAAANPALQFAWDIHDGHKHGNLDRKALISRGQRPHTQSYGGAYADASYASAPYGGEIEELFIQVDVGPTYSLAMIIPSCLAFWTQELKRGGL